MLESHIDVCPLSSMVHLCSLFEFDDFNIELMKKWEPPFEVPTTFFYISTVTLVPAPSSLSIWILAS